MELLYKYGGLVGGSPWDLTFHERVEPLTLSPWEEEGRCRGLGWLVPQGQRDRLNVAER